RCYRALPYGTHQLHARSVARPYYFFFFKQKTAYEITYRDWRILGAVAEHDPVEIVVNDNGRIIFGRCTCPHFAEHLMNQGPCEHMLALFKASEDMRADRPSSAPVNAAQQATTRRQPSRWEVDGGEAGASQ